MVFTATDTAELIGLSRRSVNTLFGRLRRKIVRWYEHQALLAGTIEIDESCFGPRRTPGKRSASGKTIVFGIFKHQGKVHTEIIPDAPKKTLQRVIRGKVIPDSVIYIGTWRGFDGLADVRYDKHYRLRYNEDEFANPTSRINGFESFWSLAKRRLTQFNSLLKHTYYLHLKELKFRFNHRNNNQDKVFRDVAALSSLLPQTLVV